MSPQEQELILQEARKRYPIGTFFKSAHYAVGGNFYTVTKDFFEWWNADELIVNHRYGPSIYRLGRWAEIIEPKVNNNYSVF